MTGADPAPAARPGAPEPGGHVIVHGLEGLGLRVVEHLVALDVEVVAIDDGARPGAVQAANALGATVVQHVDGAAAALDAAGLREARAVVCLSSSDLGALETSLLVRRLRPELPVIAQMRNPAVARAMQADAGVLVLDVASIAAPAIVEACLGAEGHGLRVDDEVVQVRTVTAPRDGALRDLYGEALVPLGVQHAALADEAVVCPGRDLEVRAGDQVSLLGTPAVWREVAPEPAAQTEATGARRRRTPAAEPTPTAALRRWSRAVLAASDVRLRRALLALTGLSVTAVVLLMVGYREADGTRMTLLDALYFTAETVGTIGYGDFSFREQPTWLRAFAVVLMLAGVVLAATTYALLTNLLVSRRLEESLGHGKVTGLRGHVVVVGLGSVGERVVESVAATGTPVVVVERDEDNRYLTQARAAGARVVSGDATLAGTLELVNLDRARAVAVLTADDLTNLEVGLAARDALGARDDVTVALRLFDRRLAGTVRRAFGLTDVRSTDELAAPWFVGAALGLEVLGTFYAGDVPMLYARVQVTPGGGLDGARVDAVTGRSRVLAVRHRDERSAHRVVRRWHTLHGGDEAFVVGPHEELLGLLRRDAVPVDHAG
ncbi:NAD-binding protein [Isoptericola sp. b441]|uniref:NAD-binding protein n=1 Tax=Actinotalea lenta TaxID=3064654 RepID=A0ABT9D7S1_9CELL|nr:MULTISPECIES: NAD-binding protein [unclassified Isoptericola]MDO8106284.1 NAD-binding protein [Isoptericola sp. b441]MDO8121996.1 NAD-binding protein [Isoptericola sp. b490]